VLTSFELEQKLGRQARERALKAAQPPTPGHSAAAAANEYAGDVEANADAGRRRSRVQHEVDPFAGDDDGCEDGEAMAGDLDKAFRQAYDNDTTGYPPMAPPSPADMFRRGPVTSGQASPGVGYDLPVPAVHVPRGVPEARAVSPDLITDTQSCPVTGGPWSDAG
jgi:hypothetical protein